MVAVIIVDVDSKFHSTFSTMRDLLNITLWSLARHNHKALSVERHHRFLNKTQPTHESFLTNIKISQYTWNSAPIDNIDIPRCLRNVYKKSTFSTSVLQILIEQRRLLHQCRQNKVKTGLTFKVGDLVKTHTNSFEGRVKKLSYQAKSLFIIT